jgi:dolichol-phosphate mannosyltransferase
MPSVSIIVPTLNEAENIEELLSRIAACCLSTAYALEVVIVDDASTDGTCDRVEKNQTRLSVRIVRRVGKRGLASAIVEGATVATGDIVLVMDADLSHPPEAIPALIAPLLNGTSDMAIGSRYIPGGTIPGWTIFRRIASRTATLLAWPLCDVKDPMSGFFAVRRDRICQLQSNVSGFKIALELLAEGGDSLRTVEVPIEFNDRLRGTSKLGLRVIWEYIHQVLKLAGGNVTSTNSLRFILVGLLGLLTDLLVFQWLFSKGAGMSAAHLTSFMAATLINYFLNSRWAFSQGNAGMTPSGYHRYGSFLMIAFLAVFLRGGVLASLTQFCGWPVHAAILAAIGAAAGVNYIGCAFFVFPQTVSGNQTALRWRILALGVVGYTLVLRAVYLGVPELLPEEAYYWNYAQHLDIGYLDHPPMVAWLIHLGTMLFGNTEFGVRFGAYVCWLVTALFSYKLTYRIFNKSAAFRALMLIATLPIFFGVGLLMTPDAPLIACWSGALYFLYRALIDEKRAAWWGAGICLGLGMLSKYSIALLGPATLLFLIVDPHSRRWFLKPAPYLAAGIALVVFSPVIIWNYHHGWASFLFQGPQRVTGEFVFSLHELIGSILLLLTPTGCAAALSILIYRKTCRETLPTLSSGSKGRSYRFGVVFLLVPLCVFIIFSLSKSIKLNWTGPLWLSLIPFIAYYMVLKTPFPYQRLFHQVQRAWPATLAVSLLVYGVSLHYVSLGLPGLPYPANFPIVGCKDLGQQIEKIENDIESVTGVEPLVVGMDKYGIASLLAFYRPKITLPNHCAQREGIADTAGRDLFGGNSLMYQYWFPGIINENRTMILVSAKRSYLEGNNILSRVKEMGDIQEITVHKNGKPVGRFFYVVTKGYTNIKRQANSPEASFISEKGFRQTHLVTSRLISE